MKTFKKRMQLISWVILLLLTLGLIVPSVAQVAAEETPGLGNADHFKEMPAPEKLNTVLKTEVENLNQFDAKNANRKEIVNDDPAFVPQSDEPDIIEVVVPAIWYPIDEKTNEVIEWLNPKPTYPDMYPRPEAAKRNDDGVYEISMMGYPMLEPGMWQVNTFYNTGNLWFTNKFHRIAAQGYRTYALNPLSTVREVVYGDFIASELGPFEFNLNGMDPMPYQEGETLHLYIVTKEGDLSTPTYKDGAVSINNRMTSEEMKAALLDHVDHVIYLNMATFLEEELDLNALDKLFIYEYTSGDEGAFIQEAGEYKNFISSLADLPAGKYEAVFPIYWQENIPEALSYPAKFSRNRYKFDDTFHFTFTKETIEDEVIPRYLVDVDVTKVWDDNENQDGLRPESVTIKLLADGIPTNRELILSETNSWTGEFANLDEYGFNSRIVYTIEEVSVEGYETEITGDSQTGLTVTNTHQVEKLDIEGSKTWNDNDNQLGQRPESITIRLLKNGTEFANKIITEEDNWSWNFEDLDKFENGEVIEYTITEDAVEFYTTLVSGYNVTNNHISEPIELPDTGPDPDSGQLPDTGIISGPYHLLGLILISIGGQVLAHKRKIKVVKK